MRPTRKSLPDFCALRFLRINSEAAIETTMMIVTAVFESRASIHAPEATQASVIDLLVRTCEYHNHAATPISDVDMPSDSLKR